MRLVRRTSGRIVARRQLLGWHALSVPLSGATLLTERALLLRVACRRLAVAVEAAALLRIDVGSAVAGLTTLTTTEVLLASTVWVPLIVSLTTALRLVTVARTGRVVALVHSTLALALILTVTLIEALALALVVSAGRRIVLHAC